MTQYTISFESSTMVCGFEGEIRYRDDAWIRKYAVHAQGARKIIVVFYMSVRNIIQWSITKSKRQEILIEYGTR